MAIADHVRLKRAYEPPAADDGTRILVDRLWPRGVSKAEAALDEWIKEIAPSTELRQWFGHDPARWHGVPRALPRRAAPAPGAARRGCASWRATAPLTLVYSAHDTAHNDAVVLRDLLLGR